MSELPASVDTVTDPVNGNWTFAASATNQADTFCYDAAGNLLSPGACASGGSKNAYLYDAYGTLLVGNYNQSPYTSYSVDEYERRVAKWQSGAIDHQYLYGADGNPVAEADGAGNWLQTNVRAGGMFLAELQPSGITYLHTDHLGTIRAESDSSGTRTMTCSNLPFGDALNCNGNTDPSGYHFTGKERDAESGNDYFGARYFGSSMGRFLSPDPAGIGYADPSNPQSLNLYSYAYNNPLINIDPSGMECVWDDGSYDASDDPDTGNAAGCSKQGGTYIDPQMFEDVEGNQAGSWSGQASSSVAFDWLTPSSNTNSGPWDLSTFLAYGSLWAAGQLPTQLSYGPNDPETLALINRPLAQAQLAAYQQAGCPASGPATNAGQDSVAAYKETARDIASGNPNYVQAEVGGYSGNISTSGGVTTVTITNVSGISSFVGYSAGVGEVNKRLGTNFNRNALDRTSGPGRNVTQTFQWKEPSPCQ